MIIEAVIIKYLEDKLKVKAYAEIPKNRPKKFILVEKIDGGRTNCINASTLSVFSYAESLYDASELNELVKDTLIDAIEIDDISSSKIGGETRSIDTQNKLYRYETIINLYHY